MTQPAVCNSGPQLPELAGRADVQPKHLSDR